MVLRAGSLMVWALLILSAVVASEHGRFCRLDEIAQGKWVRDETIAHKAFTCCSWDNDDWKRPELSHYCGTDKEATDKYILQYGRTDHNVLVGGHACLCDAVHDERVTVSEREKYHWEADGCDVMKWNATRFCEMLGDRKVMFIGDSTMIQTAGTVINMIISDTPKGLCGPQLLMNNQLDYVQGYSTAIKEHLLAFQPDITLFNFGLHYQEQPAYEKAMRDLMDVITSVRATMSPKVMEVIWKTTNMPHFSCQEHTIPTSQPPTPTPLQVDTYRWKLLPGMDAFSTKLFHEHGFAVMNMSMLSLRPDAHPGAMDCLHYCMPGPLNIAANMLMHFLLHHPKHAHSLHHSAAPTLPLNVTDDPYLP